MLHGVTQKWEDVVFMEQEETRAIRTASWLYMWRFPSDRYRFEDELYNLDNNPGEYHNIAGDPASALLCMELRSRLWMRSSPGIAILDLTCGGAEG